MKKLALITSVLTLLLASLLAACGEESLPAGAIAMVGDAVISEQAFDEMMRVANGEAAGASASPQPPAGPGSAESDQLAAQVVDMLVDQELMKQQGAKLGVAVTDEELDEAVGQFEQQLGGTQQTEEYLARRGVTMAYVETLLATQLLTQKLYAKVTSEEVQASDQQVQDYWEAHSEEFQRAPTRTLRHILLASRAEAQRVRALLAADRSAANWLKLAERYSLDPGSRNSGGSLGPIERGTLAAPLDRVAFSLKKGVLSRPVRSELGWHILEVTGTTPGRSVTFEEAESQIRLRLESRARQSAWNAWLAKLAEEAGIRYAAGYDPAELAASSPTADDGYTEPGQEPTP